MLKANNFVITFQFHHHVNEIAPITNGRWKIKVTDLKRQKDSVYHFDAVIVCIGYLYLKYYNIRKIHLQNLLVQRLLTLCSRILINP